MPKKKMEQSELRKLAVKNPALADELEQATGMPIAELLEKTELIDTHRAVPKAEGGEYIDGNFGVVTPVEHMKRHGNFRERTPEMEHLKTLVDDRNQLIKLRNGVDNRLGAYERKTDHPDAEAVLYIEQQAALVGKNLARQTKRVEKAVLALEGDYEKAMVKAAMNIRGVGPITISYCLVYLDLGGFFPDVVVGEDGKEKPHPRAGQEKCPHASSMWSYVGLDKPSHERYTKGEKGGGNKTLRTQLYTFADAQIKLGGPYREVYDRVKGRLEVSDKVVKTRNTQGKLIECAWKDTKPSHRHGAAIRALIKYFLADWWFVGRTLTGRDTNPSYATAQLGKSHRTIDPDSRGWIYKEEAEESVA